MSHPPSPDSGYPRQQYPIPPQNPASSQLAAPAADGAFRRGSATEQHGDPSYPHPTYPQPTYPPPRAVPSVEPVTGPAAQPVPELTEQGWQDVQPRRSDSGLADPPPAPAPVSTRTRSTPPTGPTSRAELPPTGVRHPPSGVGGGASASSPAAW